MSSSDDNTTNIRHVADPLAAALHSYQDALLKTAPVEAHAEIKGHIAAATCGLREAAFVAGAVPRSVGGGA
jgi:hypothetical protein